MVGLLVAFVVGAGAGFGAGRVKNAAKLSAAKAELDKLEAGAINLAGAAVAEVKSVIAAVRAKL